MIRQIALPFGLAVGLLVCVAIHSGPATAQDTTAAADESAVTEDTTGLAEFIGDEPPTGSPESQSPSPTMPATPVRAVTRMESLRALCL
jgi:hypothetical protein